jgi:DNA-binding LacI/PurR family transcriptional regulator
VPGTSLSLPDGISQRDIADEIGVSVSTVSRALAGYERVSQRTIDDVRRAITTIERRRAGFDETTFTRNLIGLTTSHVSEAHTSSQLDQITGQVLGGAEAAASRLGYRIYTARDSALLLDQGNAGFLRGMAGLILAGGLVSPAILASALDAGIPACIVGGHVCDHSIASVGSNFEHGVDVLTQHLIGLGHTRIALINGPETTFTSHEKQAGYLSALIEAGLPVDRDLITHFDAFGGFDTPNAHAIIDRMLALPAPPTAFIAATDAIAVGVISILRQRGHAIPADISVAGFQDDDIATSIAPRLTTVRVHRAAWGEAAVERIVAAANGAAMRNDRLLLPVELIVRESTTTRKNA